MTEAKDNGEVKPSTETTEGSTAQATENSSSTTLSPTSINGSSTPAPNGDRVEQPPSKKQRRRNSSSGRRVRTFVFLGEFLAIFDRCAWRNGQKKPRIHPEKQYLYSL